MRLINSIPINKLSFNQSHKIDKYYQPRASVPQVVIMIPLKTNPLFLGVCQAPGGNRSPRLWWVIGGISMLSSAILLK